MKLIADTHTHTFRSGDAYSTLQENIAAAAKRQLSYLAVTDHSCLKPGGPDNWVHFTNQRLLPRFSEGVCLLYGIEADVIGPGGKLSVPDRVLDTQDWVIASMHADVMSPRTSEDHTQMWIGIAENKYVDVIGHIGDPIFSFEHRPVLQAFADAKKVVEVNTGSLLTRPNAYPVCRQIVTLCAELGVRIIVNSDAHFSNRIGDLASGVSLLQEIGFPEELVINADEHRFRKYLEHKGIRL
ncbi:phosphatase [Ruminococcus sp. OA3]|uniref:phosphatase n=1 Tax=Ruminococcus sp. OA3 TaxID=2914164 RepID=UPI001F061A0F|nr:phosphatase [Ruminococcus sp. OA3]MCH1982214.1 phosphatase [Ruminococcus sp. OA3]